MKKLFILGISFFLLIGRFSFAQRPNIILIVTDDQGMRDASCYGSPNAITPNIDKLAKEGMKFNRAYCTTPSCSPSRSVILSGKHNSHTGHYSLGHRQHKGSAYDNTITLPVVLGRSGYHTIRVGKFHVRPEETFRFDTVGAGDNGHNPVKMAKEVGNYLDGYSGSKPFFLYFCPTDPHRSGGQNKNLPTGPNRFGNKDEGWEGVIEKIFDPAKIKVPSYLPDLQETREELSQYYQSLYRADQGIGVLIDYLKKKKLWDNSLAIFTSDNGVAFMGAKTSVYEPGINLPFIVKSPFMKNGNSETNALTSFTDIAPTILDYAGIEKVSNLYKKEEPQPSDWHVMPSDTFFDGKSIRPIIENKAKKVHEDVFISHTMHEITMYYPMRSVVSDTLKLIWNIAWPLPTPVAGDIWGESTVWKKIIKDSIAYYGVKKTKSLIQRPQFELYNLKKDPWETKNLANEPAYAMQLEAFKQKIKNYQTATKDPWIIKWEHE